MARQKKPQINKRLFGMLVSGVSLRRASTLLGVQYNTVVQHFRLLSQQAQEHHQKALRSIQTSFVQVDELETFLHARPKALSVPMVVRVKTGHILGFAVAKMPAKGNLAAIGQSQYGWVADDRPVKFQSMIYNLKGCFKPNITFKCDSSTSYPKWIHHQLVPPDHQVTIQQVLGAKKKTLAERTHRCACGVVCDRDENAAKTLLRWLLEGDFWTGTVPGGPGPHETPFSAA